MLRANFIYGDMKTASQDETFGELKIRTSLQPGDIGTIILLHGIYYSQKYGFDHTFDAYVAGPLSEFAKRNDDRERIWIVELAGEIVGTIAIVRAADNRAQLRWLLITPKAQGRGIGKLLMQKALDFCRAKNYEAVFLWTVNILTAAAQLYRLSGFLITEEASAELWGTTVTEQCYQLILN